MIAVCTTLTTFAMDDPQVWGSWLTNCDEVAASHPDVRYFVAIEIDARGLEPFRPLTDALTDMADRGIRTDWWTYHLDDQRTSVTTANRLRHLTMGQQLCSTYATDEGASHMLFLAADLAPPPDALPKLLAVDHPLVGGHVSTYCQGIDDMTLAEYPAEWDVREQAMTAAFVLIARSLFKVVKWRADGEAGMSDDPAFTHDAMKYHGIRTLVRRDCEGKHYPESIPAIEHRGYDMTVER